MAEEQGLSGEDRALIVRVEHSACIRDGAGPFFEFSIPALHRLLDAARSEGPLPDVSGLVDRSGVAAADNNQEVAEPSWRTFLASDKDWLADHGRKMGSGVGQQAVERLLVALDHVPAGNNHKALVEQWRPISNAPTDGTHILACIAGTSFGWWDGVEAPPVQTVVHWWAAPGEEGFYTSVNELEPQNTFGATHWKALDGPVSGRAG